MKNTFKYLMALLLAGSSIFYSCETIELEQLANPNSLTPEQADPSLLLNSVQLAYLANMQVFNNNASNLTRLEVFGSRDYFAGVPGTTLNTTWSRLYSTANGDTRGMIPNIQAISDLNTAAGDGSLNYTEGVAKALLAHQLMLMVDFVGDIPYSQSNNPSEFPAPVADAGADVYASALGLLTEAAALVNGATGTDLFYSDASKWLKFINTVRMKAALTTGDLTTFNSIASNDANFISSSADDFQFQYGTQDVNPNERHDDYNNDYTPSGANGYRSGWLMYTMMGDDQLSTVDDDPRMRYYFFRQTDCTPGSSCNPNPTGTAVVELNCSIVTAPLHLPADQFCFLENGYWGRFHGDDAGVPPDSFARTAAGVYPAAGFVDGENYRNGIIAFDDDAGEFVFQYDSTDDFTTLGAAGEGAGIEPFILASYVDFMRAEVALQQNNVAGAAGFIEAGLEKSIAKVQSFASLDPIFSPGALLDGTTFDATTGEIIVAETAANGIPTTADNEAFIAATIAAFNAGSNEDQWNILAEQNWITQYGGGAETYNFYRRTGYPTTLTPNLEPNPGTFPRSFPYPANEVTANPNISQKADQSVQVFWDNNPPSAVTGGFPSAN